MLSPNQITVFGPKCLPRSHTSVASPNRSPRLGTMEVSSARNRRVLSCTMLAATVNGSEYNTSRNALDPPSQRAMNSNRKGSPAEVIKQRRENPTELSSRGFFNSPPSQVRGSISFPVAASRIGSPPALTKRTLMEHEEPTRKGTY